MSYKAVKAIALGTVALSTGIVHFDPDRKSESDADERYHGGIFLEADADKLERRGVGKIVGDATEADYKKWFAHITAGNDIHQVGAERVQEMADTDEDTESPAVDNVETIAHPRDTAARSPSIGRTLDPDAVPGGEEERAEPSILDANLKDLKASLAGVDSVEELKSLRESETAGKSRDGALAAIDARIEAVEAGTA